MFVARFGDSLSILISIDKPGSGACEGNLELLTIEPVSTITTEEPISEVAKESDQDNDGDRHA